MRDWFGFDPFGESASMRDALREFLGERPTSPFDLAPSAVASVFVPVDVMDLGPEVVVRANLPGVQADDLSITFLNNNLTIRGELKEDPEFKGANYLRRERRATTFSRSIHLPMALEMENAEAQIENGVLTLRIPKSEKIRPKTIKVTTA